MKPQSGRVRRPNQGRVGSWAVLGVVSCGAGLALLLGDLPARGLGLAALVGGAALACLLAWRENRAAQRVRAAHALHEALLFAEQLHAERVRHGVVVDALSRRNAAVRAQAERAAREICALRREVSTLRGNYEALRVELELQAVLESDAQVVELGRREATIDPWVTARELWRRDEPDFRRPA